MVKLIYTLIAHLLIIFGKTTAFGRYHQPEMTQNSQK